MKIRSFWLFSLLIAIFLVLPGCGGEAHNYYKLPIESEESIESEETIESEESLESEETIESEESLESEETKESEESLESEETKESEESLESEETEESGESLEHEWIEGYEEILEYVETEEPGLYNESGKLVSSWNKLMSSYDRLYVDRDYIYDPNFHKYNNDSWRTLLNVDPSYYLVLPDDITKIGDGVFGCCRSLFKIELPDSVKSIGDHAFDCSGLAVINFPSSLTSIGEYTFCSSKIVSANLSGTSLNSIGKNAFSHCYELTDVDLSGTSITSIEERTFYECNSLTTIKLPNTLKTIGSYAFYHCKNLSIEIPTSVSIIYSNMFGSNADNVTITYNGKSYTYAKFHNFKTDFVNYRAGNAVI